MVYDLQGRRTSLIDPDAGTITSTYTGFGELITETQKIHTDKPAITTTHNYNSNGVLQSIVRNEEITKYAYDKRNRVDSIEIKNQHLQTQNQPLQKTTKLTPWRGR